MSLATPEKIRSLQRKLYRKAKAEPAFRFYVLYDKICREDILRHAYGLARANAGAPGVDGVTFAQIEAAGPGSMVGGLARGTGREEVPARDETKRLLAMAGTLRNRLLLSLGYGAGLRAGEGRAARDQRLRHYYATRNSSSCRPASRASRNHCGLGPLPA